MIVIAISIIIILLCSQLPCNSRFNFVHSNFDGVPGMIVLFVCLFVYVCWIREVFVCMCRCVFECCDSMNISCERFDPPRKYTIDGTQL